MGINGERVTRTAQHGLSHVLGPSNNSATRSRGSAQGLDFSGRNHDNAQCHSVTHSPPLTTDRHRPGKRQLGATLLGVYLGFAPIYWLPYLDPVALRGAKAVFLIAALALVLVTRRTGILFPAGLLSPASFLVLLLLAVPGMFQAVSFGTVLQFIFDVVLSAVFLWVFFTLRLRGASTVYIFRIASIVVGSFALLPLLAGLTGIPHFQSPFARATFSATGFGGGRTGWANAIALYLPFAIAMAMDKRRVKTAARACAATVALIIVGAQIVSGGRTGIIMGLFSLIVLLWLGAGKGLKVAGVIAVFFGFVALAFTSASAIIQGALVAKLRLEGGADGGAGLALVLDQITSYRFSGYVEAVEALKERPLQGHGLDQVLVWVPLQNRETEIHNLWLKLAVYTGVLHPAFLLLMVGSLGITALRNLRRCRTRLLLDEGVGYILVVFTGIAVSMVEPASLVGAFQNTAVWWGVAGAVVAIGKLRRRPDGVLVHASDRPGSRQR